MKKKMLKGEQEIGDIQLTPIENKYADKEYVISITLPEFTCKCPLSGYPDFAVIRIKYIPKSFIIELKSLKLYINKFRDQYIFHEEIPNRILEDLVQVINPQWMEIIGDFSPRGNVKTILKTEYHEEKGYVLSNTDITINTNEHEESFK